MVDCLGPGASCPLVLYVLQTLRCLAAAGESVCEEMLTRTVSPGTGRSRYEVVTSMILLLMRGEGVEEGEGGDAAGVRYRALTLLGELAYARKNREAVLGDEQVMSTVRMLSLTQVPPEGGEEGGGGRPKSPKLRKGASFRASGIRALSLGGVGGGGAGGKGDLGGACGGGCPGQEVHGRPGAGDVVRGARRVLAILGDNQALSLSLGPAPFMRVGGRGARVLSIDGGGVKGVAAIKMLADLEGKLGRPLNQVPPPPTPLSHPWSALFLLLRCLT